MLKRRGRSRLCGGYGDQVTVFIEATGRALRFDACA